MQGAVRFNHLGTRGLALVHRLKRRRDFARKKVLQRGAGIDANSYWAIEMSMKITGANIIKNEIDFTDWTAEDYAELYAWFATQDEQAQRCGITYNDVYNNIVNSYEGFEPEIEDIVEKWKSIEWNLVA